MAWNSDRTAKTGKGTCPGCFDPDCECQDEAPEQEQPDPFPTTPKEQKEWAKRQATPELIQALLDAGVPEEVALHVNRAEGEAILAEAQVAVVGVTGTARVQGDEIVLTRSRWQRRVYGLDIEQRFERATTRVEYRAPTATQVGYLWFVPHDMPDTRRPRKLSKIGRDRTVIVIKLGQSPQVENFMSTLGLDGAVYADSRNRYENQQEWDETREIETPRLLRWFRRQIEPPVKTTEVHVRIDDRREDR